MQHYTNEYIILKSDHYESHDNINIINIVWVQLYYERERSKRILWLYTEPLVHYNQQIVLQPKHVYMDWHHQPFSSYKQEKILKKSHLAKKWRVEMGGIY